MKILAIGDVTSLRGLSISKEIFGNSERKTKLTSAW